MRRSSFSNQRLAAPDPAEYPLAADLARPLARVTMSRLPQFQGPGSTVHVVDRCKNREFCFTTPDDFRMLTARLGEMVRTYEVTLYAYTLMANHVHLLLQERLTDPIARSLRTPRLRHGSGMWAWYEWEG